MKQPNYNVSEGRKILFYGGMVLSIIGLLMFLSTFLSLFTGRGPNMAAPFVGILLIAAGQVIRTIGQRGLAGSGVILDPQQAREDLEPYARSAGGLLKDALEETDLTKPGEPVVKVRCRICQALNDETANYCQQCGEKL